MRGLPVPSSFQGAGFSTQGALSAIGGVRGREVGDSDHTSLIGLITYYGY